MNNFKTDIIPSKQKFTGARESIDYKAICVFSAIGFFLGQDTFWNESKVLPPATEISHNQVENNIFSKKYFKWHYSPRKLTLDEATEEFAAIFEKILLRHTENKRVILPLSGGLDSRTQAAGLSRIGANINSYSYSFKDGHDETLYSQQIAKKLKFDFQSWEIKSGYLWDVIDQLALINGCYSEFTHPRQMAFYEKFSGLGDVFSLGHWGDVLFDDMGVPDELNFDAQVEVVLKKIVKKSGYEIGRALWNDWSLEGNFDDYLRTKIEGLLSDIEIPDNANSQIRAFKSMYWAPRWTSVNLQVFSSIKPVTLPYYDNEMCEFICSIPEQFLSGRKIQVNYLKRFSPQLAKITWQDHRPFNLYNYHFNRAPWNLPVRVYSKLKRNLSSKKAIQRNWELQFLGRTNDMQLRNRLFHETKMTEWISPSLIEKFYQKFVQTDSVYYAHSISILLTLSLFAKHFKERSGCDNTI